MTKASERNDHIAYWQQSGQTKKAYCELAGIKYATFISWFKNQPDPSAGQFVKLEKKMTQEVSGRLEILLPNGIRIYSSQELSVELLKNLQDV
jgi:hypothetical protein